jgi:hypothetical protein
LTLQTTTIQVQSQAGVTVHNPFMYHDDPRSTRLTVMLPGRGYTCDYPVLYYLRRAAIKHGFDVLSIEYGFQAAHLDLDVQTTAYLQDDVLQAVAPVLQRGYEQVCIVGKSLGTPLAAELVKIVQVEDLSVILLTPIGGAFEGMDTIRALAMIGTDDAFYSPEMIAAFPNIQWRVFDGLNHSLEVKGDWKASIAALGEVIATCEEFLLSKE